MKESQKNKKASETIATLQITYYADGQTGIDYEGYRDHLIVALGNAMMHDSVIETIVQFATEAVKKKREKEEEEKKS